MAIDGSIMAAATVSLGQSVTAYSFFLPPLREVRRAGTGDASMRGDVRLGQLAAGGVTLAVGVMLSYLVGSPIPLATAVVTALVIAAVYEMALNGERVME